MIKRLGLLLASLLLAFRLCAQSGGTGSVAGLLIDATTGQPVEFATFTLRDAAKQQPVRTTASNARGLVGLTKVPFGRFVATYGLLGGDEATTAPFTLDATHRKIDLGRLAVSPAPLRLEKFEVKSRRETFSNTIDRKVYDVAHDAPGATDSASGLLQNLPSVQVDIDGNVSLRGNTNVLVLVDGKPSTLMNSANRAMALEQMPAAAIERIEVITNPSAKYKPDGTAGIINLVLKRQHQLGSSGAVSIGAGTASRYGFRLNANYNPGAWNLYASLNVRQDDRLRYVYEDRSHLDPASNTFLGTTQSMTEHMRPLSRLVQTGTDWQVNDATKISASLSYNYRTFFRNSTLTNVARDGSGHVTGDYDRLRTDPEWQKTTEFSASAQHDFATPGQTLGLALKQDRHWEQEDNHYTDIYRFPVTPISLDYTAIKPTETGTELTLDYSQPFANDASLDTGYALDVDKNDMNFQGGTIDPVTGTATIDPTTTNRFIYHDHIHALYATFGRPVGNFGFLAGLRAEQAIIDTDQVTTALVGKNDYFRLYPTLHLNYNLTETGQLQLNYSHRIRRPESDDLNPFPEYQDPFNLRAGNPSLLPEDTHSVESGYQYKDEATTLLAALYYRETYHAFTTVTRYLDSTTLLTTQENLATNSSGGLELAATGELGDKVNVNISADFYQNQIDASNLGYSAVRSAFAWDAKLNVGWHVTKNNLLQFKSNYTARRLTAQGYRLPTYVANFGLRHEFPHSQTTFFFTVSDLFDSLKERTIIDTPILHDDLTRRRSSRVFYAGFVYGFGQTARKKKDDPLQYDDKL
ncbi:MAG: TonB-dependent receptor domain-containing protein [Opitutales bacterium]